MISTLLSTEDFKINPVFITSIKKYNMKFKTDFDLSRNSADLNQIFIKKINKTLSIQFVFNYLYIIKKILIFF